MKFTKMHGIGNDYIYFDCTKEDLPEPEKIAIKLSDRHFSVGGDGIVMICKSQVADFKMRMFNIDGSEGKMCGNASRCIGKYVYDRGLTDKTTVTLETLGGIKVLNLKLGENGKVESVTVDMGKAILEPTLIPVNYKGDRLVGETVKIAGGDYKITAVSMGNPHCVIFTEQDVNDLDLTNIGPEFENDSLFPERVNTEFVNIIDGNTLKMRVWERGSGETMACGTGACAVAVSAVENGFCKRDTDITVKLIGGDLSIKYMSDGTVFMTGPAAFAFDGEVLD
jgi:diaminopimelate epimerase